MSVLAALGDAPTAAIAIVAILLGIVVAARGQRGQRADEKAGPTLLTGVPVAAPAGGDDAADGLAQMAPHDVGHGTIRLGGVASPHTEPEVETARVPPAAVEPEPVVAAEPEVVVEPTPTPEPPPEPGPASWPGVRAGQWTAPPAPVPPAEQSPAPEAPAAPEEPPAAAQAPPAPRFGMGRVRFRKPPRA